MQYFPITRAMEGFKKSCAVTLLGLAWFVLQETSATQLGRGFNNNIDWVNLKDGLQLAREQDKPLMVLIHKSWCGSCKQLKPKFDASVEIQSLSSNFVMVNIMDEEEEDIGGEYAPEGAKYIPRILFVDSTGRVRTEIYNARGNTEYPFYYYEPPQIISSMQTAVRLLGSSRGERPGGEL